jgi:hypothetical protein
MKPMRAGLPDVHCVRPPVRHDILIPVQVSGDSADRPVRLDPPDARGQGGPARRDGNARDERNGGTEWTSSTAPGRTGSASTGPPEIPARQGFLGSL